MVAGVKARCAIAAWTVPAAAEGAQAAPPAPPPLDAAGVASAGAGELAPPVAVDVPPVQAATDRTAVMARTGNRRRDMASSSSRIEWIVASSGVYVRTVGPVSNVRAS
jgi:hypothetical protein